MSVTEKLGELSMANNLVEIKIDLATDKIEKNNEKLDLIERVQMRKQKESDTQWKKKEIETTKELRELKEERKLEKEKKEQERIREEKFQKLLEDAPVYESDINENKSDIKELRTSLREQTQIYEDNSAEMFELKKEIEKLKVIIKYQEEKNKKLKQIFEDRQNQKPSDGKSEKSIISLEV